MILNNRRFHHEVISLPITTWRSGSEKFTRSYQKVSSFDKWRLYACKTHKLFGFNSWARSMNSLDQIFCLILSCTRASIGNVSGMACALCACMVLLSTERIWCWPPSKAQEDCVSWGLSDGGSPKETLREGKSQGGGPDTQPIDYLPRVVCPAYCSMQCVTPCWWFVELV